MASAEQVKQAAESLVIRARQGDQNAMGMIVAIRQNRDSGSRKAALAYDYIASYIRNNPVQERSAFGNDCQCFAPLARASKNPRHIVAFVLSNPMNSDDALKASHVLTRTLTLSPRVLKEILGEIPPEIRPIFRPGFMDPLQLRQYIRGLDERGRKALLLGYILGTARDIQDVGAGRSPIAKLSPMAAWELGEN